MDLRFKCAKTGCGNFKAVCVKASQEPEAETTVAALPAFASLAQDTHAKAAPHANSQTKMSAWGTRSESHSEELMPLFEFPPEVFSSTTQLQAIKPLEGDSFDAEHAAVSLIRLIPTEYEKSCQVAKRVVRHMGLTAFTKLTSVKTLWCGKHAVSQKGGKAMLCSQRRYEMLAQRLERHVHRRYIVSRQPKRALEKKGQLFMQSMERDNARRFTQSNVELKLQHDRQANSVTNSLRQMEARLKDREVQSTQEFREALSGDLEMMQRLDSMKVADKAAGGSSVAKTGLLEKFQGCIDAAMQSLGNRDQALVARRDILCGVPELQQTLHSKRLPMKALRLVKNVDAPKGQEEAQPAGGSLLEELDLDLVQVQWGERIKAGARYVKNKVRAAANWVKKKVRQWARKLRQAIMKAVRKLRKLAKKLKDKIGKIWNKLKDGLKKLWDAVLNFAKKAKNFVVGLIKKLWKSLPKFRYLEIGQIYIKCFTDPKNCDMSEARIPSFKICFSVIDCFSTPTMPTFGEIGKWLMDNTINKVKTWLTDRVKWKEMGGFKFPKKVGGTYIKSAVKKIYYPKPIIKKCNTKIFGKTVSVPCGFTLKREFWKNVKVPAGINTEVKSMKIPVGLNTGGAAAESKQGVEAGAKKMKSEEAAQKKRQQDASEAAAKKEASFKTRLSNDNERFAKVGNAAEAYGVRMKKRSQRM